MGLQQRLDLLIRLGVYLLSNENTWQAAKEKAFHENGWFTPQFIELATTRIAKAFLQKELLNNWVSQYGVPEENTHAKNVGIVMAGNIPLVGFHDLLCAFITGHQQTIKPSSKDETLIRHLVEQLHQWDAGTKALISFSTMLKGCDAYIATGSSNSARYFDYYFSKYLHIIRRNRTSVAILTGEESKEELELLADDVHEYFGLGCRNVTKIYVPQGYDFIPLLESGKKYQYMADHHKYKNNYDYQLALLILNKQYYMTNDVMILHESKQVFSAISQLHFEYYQDAAAVVQSLRGNEDIQCITGRYGIPFGKAQEPGLTDYADGVDTLQFLLKL